MMDSIDDRFSLFLTGGGAYAAQREFGAYFAVADVNTAVDIEVRFPSVANGAPIVIWKHGMWVSFP